MPCPLHRVNTDEAHADLSASSWGRTGITRTLNVPASAERKVIGRKGSTTSIATSGPTWAANASATKPALSNTSISGPAQSEGTVMTPRLLSDMVFEGGEAASAVVAAWRFLADAETGVRTDYTKAPVGVVSRAWKPLVFPETGRVDRRAYTFCVLEAMRDHLRRRDVFVPASRRFADPRAQLLSGPGWESAGPQNLPDTGFAAER